jgi:hypothetical protein
LPAYRALVGSYTNRSKKFRGGQKTPYYNRPTQDGLRGHFVLRAIGKRFRKDRTAGCEKVVGIRFALDSSLEGDGFELPLEIRTEENCGFPGLAIGVIVPQTRAK